MTWKDVLRRFVMMMKTRSHLPTKDKAEVSMNIGRKKI
jgi:hypothetical protein